MADDLSIEPELDALDDTEMLDDELGDASQTVPMTPVTDESSNA